jgi:hypothetical protein
LRDDPGMMNQRRSYRREPDAPSLAFQQRRAECFFHGTDPLARRCQCHIRTGGPMRDAGGFCDVQKQSEVYEIEANGHIRELFLETMSLRQYLRQT